MIPLRRLFVVFILLASADVRSTDAQSTDTLRVQAHYADGSMATVLTFYGAGRTWTVPPRAAAFERFAFERPDGGQPDMLAFEPPPADSAARAAFEAALAEVMAIPYEGFETMALEMAEEAEAEGMMMGPMLRIPDAFPRDERARAAVPLRVTHLRALDAPPGVAEAEGDRLIYAELEKTYVGDDPACPIRARLPVWFLEGGGGVSILSEHLELSDCADPRPAAPPLTPHLLVKYGEVWWALATQPSQAASVPVGTAGTFVLTRIASGDAQAVGTAYTNAR